MSRQEVLDRAVLLKELFERAAVHPPTREEIEECIAAIVNAVRECEDLNPPPCTGKYFN